MLLLCLMAVLPTEGTPIWHVQVLESREEIFLFYEVYRIRYPRFLWISGHPMTEVVEQGCAVIRPGCEPCIRRLKPAYAVVDFDDGKSRIRFHPNLGHVFFFDGSIHIRVGPAMGEGLQFFTLREDQFVPATEQTDGAIREGLGIGGGPRESVRNQPLDHLSAEGGWHFGYGRDSQYHKASFFIGTEKSPEGPDRDVSLWVEMEHEGETTKHLIAQVRDDY